jgi:hypothetical protein
VWWTGLGGATPCGGQARIRSRRTENRGGGRVPTGQHENQPRGVLAGCRVRRPPGSSSHLWEVFESYAGDVTFQAAHSLSVGESFGSAALDVVAGSKVAGFVLIRIVIELIRFPPHAHRPRPLLRTRRGPAAHQERETGQPGCVDVAALPVAVTSGG